MPLTASQLTETNWKNILKVEKSMYLSHCSGYELWVYADGFTQVQIRPQDLPRTSTSLQFDFLFSLNKIIYV